MNFTNRLILYPNHGDPENISSQQIVELLLNEKIIANTWYYKNQNYYLIGENFLKYIIFMGCSPAIETLPDKDNLPGSNFVAINIIDLKKITFYPGDKNYHYRCNSCKTDILLAENRLPIQDTIFSCKNCNTEYDYKQVNWRHRAGLSHLFIEICGIFNGEAIPADSFLSLLTNHSFQCDKWNYFYAQ
jgi:hypothetical protein